MYGLEMVTRLIVMIILQYIQVLNHCVVYNIEITLLCISYWASLVAQVVKNLSAVQETWV